MKRMIVITIAIALVASAATAGIPEGALRSVNKIPPVKDTSTGTKLGLLDCTGATRK